MTNFKGLEPQNLDAMVLDLFALREHAEWFWRNDDNTHTPEALLKSGIRRSIQMQRAQHREKPLVDWVDPQSLFVLFAGAMVLASPASVAQGIQSCDLHESMVAYWCPAAINQVFTWMHGDDDHGWNRCRKRFKKEKFGLKKENLVLLEHLSLPLQTCFSFCASLNTKPSENLLRQSYESGKNHAFDISGLLENS